MTRPNKLCVGQRPTGVRGKSRVRERSPPPMKRLRLRGDWSDTGPNARPDTRTSNEQGAPANEEAVEAPAAGGDDDDEEHDNVLDGQVPPRRRGGSVNMNLMQRMTDALSRMLNDPSTRLAMRTLSERETARGNSSPRRETSEPPPATSSNAEPQPSSPSRRGSSGQNAIGRTINDIQDSITTMREEFIDRYVRIPLHFKR